MPRWAWLAGKFLTRLAASWTCFEEQNYGLELKAAIENLIDRVPVQDLRIVATAIMIQKESGGNLAEVLDKTAYVIRERFRLRRQIRHAHGAGKADRVDPESFAGGAGNWALHGQSNNDEHSLDTSDRYLFAVGLSRDDGAVAD